MNNVKSFLVRNKFMIMILLLSLFLRLIVSVDNDKFLFLDVSTYDSFAMNILKYGHLYNSAYQAPGYTYFLAIIYWLFGHSLINVYIVQSVLGTISTLLIYLIAENIFDRRVAKVSAALSLLYWPLTQYSGILLSETLFIFLFLSGILAFLKALDTGKAKYFAFAAVFFSLSALVRSISLLFIVFIPLLYVVYRYKHKIKALKHLYDFSQIPSKTKDLRVVFRNIAIYILVFMTVLSPWVGRNYIKYNEIILVDTLGGLNLYIGNNPKSNGFFVSLQDDPQYNIEGENDYETDSRLKKLAINYIIKHPIRFLLLTVVRMGIFLFADFCSYDWVLIQYMSNNVLFSYCPGIWTVFMAICCSFFFFLSIWGMKSFLRSFKGSIMLVFILYFFLLTSMFYISSRYRLPIMPLMAISAAFGFERLVNINVRVKNRTIGYFQETL